MHCTRTHIHARRNMISHKASRLVDLTYELDEKTISAIPGTTAFRMHEVVAGPVHSQGLPWLAMNDFTMNEHVGTHVDSPYHGAENGLRIDEIPLDHLHGPAVLIDIVKRSQLFMDATVNVRDLEDWEKEHGTIPSGAFVLMNSGWGQYWGDPDAYRGISGEDSSDTHFPGFSISATEWLLRERDILGLGSDTISCDCGKARDFPTHQTLFKHNKICVLNIANIEQLPSSGAELFVMPLKIKGGSGAPARVFAIVNEEQTP